MILFRLFYEFFMIGLLAVGGGLATIPFLTKLANDTGWFTVDQLTNMIAVSQAMPGPVGVNLSTYVGYQVAGFSGAIFASLGLVTPCIAVILIVCAFLQKFRNSMAIQDVFYGLRPASAGLIAAACWSVITLSLLTLWPQNGDFIIFHWECIAIAAIVFFFTNYKKTKKIHPIVWIFLSAVAGIVLEL